MAHETQHPQSVTMTMAERHFPRPQVQKHRPRLRATTCFQLLTIKECSLSKPQRNLGILTAEDPAVMKVTAE